MKSIFLFFFQRKNDDESIEIFIFRVYFEFYFSFLFRAGNLNVSFFHDGHLFL
jgi:hypothetical protein